MLSLTATIDVSELRRTAARLQTRLQAACVGAVRDACEQGAAEARDTRRYKDRTGALTASIQGHLLTGTATDAEGEITAGVNSPASKYASFVDGGTKAHPITAKNKPLLRWQDASGHWWSKRTVQHPGTKPYGFMGSAYLKAERVLEVAADVAVARAVADVGG